MSDVALSSEMEYFYNTDYERTRNWQNCERVVSLNLEKMKEVIASM